MPSLLYGEMIEGGLIDNADVTWTDLKFCFWDYNGQIQVPQPALAITMLQDGEQESITQYYSFGSRDHFIPSEDGMSLVQVGSQAGVSRSSNGALLMKSLEEAGYPRNLLQQGRADTFMGLKCHMVRQPAPKRAGLPERAQSDRSTQSDRPQTILLVTNIVALPGQAPAQPQTQQPVVQPAPQYQPQQQQQPQYQPQLQQSPQQAQAQQPAPQPQQPQQQAAEFDQELVNILVPLVQEAIGRGNGAPIRVATLVPLANEKHSTHQRYADMPRTLMNPNFLSWGASQSLWKYDRSASTVSA